MKIKVLGSGCKSCKKLYEDVNNVVKENNFDANVEYVTDLMIMMNYGIMNAPAIVINEKVVSSGKSLNKKEIIEVLEGNASFSEKSSCECGTCHQK